MSVEIKEVPERPESGQWVEVWFYDGKPWSDTLYREPGGGLCMYNSETDKFDPVSADPLPRTRFFVAAEGGNL